MFFNKKAKCGNCSSNVEKKFSFCPYCGSSLSNKEEEMKEFGLLGKNDMVKEEMQGEPLANMGITDKLVNSLMNSMMKSLDKQFKNIAAQDVENLENASIEQLPNGIKIRIGVPHVKPKPKQHKRKEITPEQLERMSKLPRTEAKSKIRRLSDKVIYEIAAPGIESPDDIFISKLESGYEIKAIGKKKIYTNTIPMTLPLRGFSFDSKGLFVEFKIEK
jgi:hypothetical protein